MAAMEQRICAADDCTEQFTPKREWQTFCSLRCKNRDAVRRLRARRKKGGGGGNGGGGGGGSLIDIIHPVDREAFFPRYPLSDPKSRARRKPSRSAKSRKAVTTRNLNLFGEDDRAA